MQLLQEYASGRSEEAFAALVSRHINLVYSAALRSVNNPSQAEEITQSVFLTLAQKARILNRNTILSGWLYQTARLTASNFIRGENRRLKRENRAHLESTMNDPEPEAWPRVGPLLDEAMAQLPEKDRNAIVLRFFEGKPLRAVGDALGSSEDAAKMRVNRALDKLRDFFHSRGITMSATALATAIAENSIHAAPTGLAATVAAGALKGSAAASLLTIIKGAVSMTTSAKIGITLGACVAAAVIGLQYHHISSQTQIVKDLQTQVAQLAPQVKSSQGMVAEVEQLKAQNAAYAKTIDTMKHDVAKARAHASEAIAAKTTAAAKQPDAKSNGMQDMFKDPAVLAAIKDSQLIMFKKQYGGFVKSMNMTPDQADQFYNALLEQGNKGIEMLQGGKLDPAAMATSQDDLKNLLGEDGMTKFTEYSQNVAAQTMLDLYKGNFVDNPLTPTQEKQLMETMQTASQSQAAPNPADMAKASDGDISGLMEQQMQRQQQLNQTILDQAAAYLTPDQLQTLASSQSNMLSMQKAGMAMAQKMFTPAAQK